MKIIKTIWNFLFGKQEKIQQRYLVKRVVPKISDVTKKPGDPTFSCDKE